MSDGSGNDLNGNRRDWESKRHSRTPLIVRVGKKSPVRF